MTTLTKYQVEHQDGSKLGQKHGSLVDAVLEAAGHDGFHARFERMDDDSRSLFGLHRVIGDQEVVV